MNEVVHVGVVLPSHASLLGVPGVDVVVLLSPGDGGVAGADALDGLKGQRIRGGVERKRGFRFYLCFPAVEGEVGSGEVFELQRGLGGVMQGHDSVLGLEEKPRSQ